ncbi:MAG: GNAT family N-acetyltransferase [Myxococcota bacterium]
MAVIGGDTARRVRCNRAGMRALLPVALRAGAAWTVGDADAPVRGAMIATPPRRYPLPPPSLGVELRTLWVQGPRVRGRWARVFDHLHALHPPSPHWYLSTLGVAPEARRRGLGRALVARLADRADAAGVPCYLETDRPENLAFYEPAGFRVERESEILGVRVWHLTRPAVTP